GSSHDWCRKGVNLEVTSYRRQVKLQEESDCASFFQPAPRTLDKSFVVTMAGVAWTDDRLTGQRLQRFNPGSRLRPARILCCRQGERLLKQRGRLRRQIIQAQTARRRSHLHLSAVRRKRKSIPPHHALNEHLSGAQKSSGKRVASHQKKMENQQSQTEIVVVLRPDKSGKVFSLKLRRSVGRHADFTEKAVPIVGYLKTIAVD